MDAKVIQGLLKILVPIYIMHRSKGSNEEESLRMAKKEAKLIIDALPSSLAGHIEKQDDAGRQ
jgi:hypothetical protein